MTSPWIAAVAALFLWWFFTGAILMVVQNADKGGRDRHVWTVLLTTPALLLGVFGYMQTLQSEGVADIYVAFVSILAIWGWIELTFLAGIVTGPNTSDCPRGLPEWERFIRAWGTLAYHEMLLLAALLVLGYLSQGATNPFGFWTFAVLYFARISAKLNLYLGVPRINTEFLTQSLSHLPSHFRIASMNALFPVSVTVLAFATACWLERIYSATTAAEIVGFALLTALTALALLEHWFMVIPLPDAKLWRWLMPAPNQK